VCKLLLVLWDGCSSSATQTPSRGAGAAQAGPELQGAPGEESVLAARDFRPGGCRFKPSALWSRPSACSPSQ